MSPRCERGQGRAAPLLPPLPPLPPRDNVSTSATQAVHPHGHVPFGGFAMASCAPPLGVQNDPDDV